jgi:hypothetical protein
VTGGAEVSVVLVVGRVDCKLVLDSGVSVVARRVVVCTLWVVVGSGVDAETVETASVSLVAVVVVMVVVVVCGVEIDVGEVSSVVVDDVESGASVSVVWLVVG